MNIAVTDKKIFPIGRSKAEMRTKKGRFFIREIEFFEKELQVVSPRFNVWKFWDKNYGEIYLVKFPKSSNEIFFGFSKSTPKEGMTINFELTRGERVFEIIILIKIMDYNIKIISAEEIVPELYFVKGMIGEIHIEFYAIVES